MGACNAFGLILSDQDDLVARWVEKGLRSRGVAVELVSADALYRGALWRHTIGQGEARFDLLLSDGRRIGTDDVRWVLNRLSHLPEAYLAAVEAGDRAYVEQEWGAMLCSVLHSLHVGRVTVVDPPVPYALGGRWRSPGEWTLLAAQAGFRVHAWRWHDVVPDPPPGVAATWVLVIGDRVLCGEHVSADTQDACRRLAALAQKSLVQVYVDLRESAAVFCGIAPMVDPRLAGDAALDALQELLTR
jgi:hypothetical protein